ncbi:MAG: hypothetical protein IKO91_03155 [Oscillospiraceae bacterium]|nr:hypothetical protein [Oscillospiraceae bacterium]
MRRLIVWLVAPVLLLCLTACSDRSNAVTPGNISTATKMPYVPPNNENADDVSGEYRKELCTYPWLDTDSMEYYQLAEDGTFVHYEDEALTDPVGDGSWKLLKNTEGKLTLHMEVSGGKAFDLYDLELYDQSIYARGLDDYAYIWLLAGPEE